MTISQMQNHQAQLMEDLNAANAEIQRLQDLVYQMKIQRENLAKESSAEKRNLENDSLKLKKRVLMFENIQSDSEFVNFYTGFEDAVKFNAFADSVE